MRGTMVWLVLCLTMTWGAWAASPKVEKQIEPIQLQDVTAVAPVAKNAVKGHEQPIKEEQQSRVMDLYSQQTRTPVMNPIAGRQDQLRTASTDLRKPGKSELSMLAGLPRRGVVEFQGPSGTTYKRDGLRLEMTQTQPTVDRSVSETFFAWDTTSPNLSYTYSSTFTANTWVGAVFVPSDDGIWPYKAVEFSFLNYDSTNPWQAIGVNQDNSWYPTSVMGMQFANVYGADGDWTDMDLGPHNIYFFESGLALHGLIRWCSAGGACNALGADRTNPNLIDWDHNSQDNGGSWSTYTNVDWMLNMTVEVMPDTGDFAYYFPYPIGATVNHNTCAHGADSGIVNDYAPPASGPYAVGGGEGYDLIYNIYPPIDLTLNITMTPTGFDGLIYLCTDYADILNTTIAASNNAGSGVAESISNIALLANTDYYLIVDGHGVNDCGAFSLSMVPPGITPPNDTCANPTTMTLPYEVTHDLYLANDNYSGEECGVVANGPDRVYQFTPTGDMAVAINVEPMDFDAVLYVTTACPPTGSGDCVVSADLGVDWEPETISCFLATSGVTYYVFVDGYEEGVKGAYNLSVTATTAPTNDTCPTAEVLTLGVEINGNTACSVDDYDGLCTGATQNGPDLVYSYTPTENTTMAFILEPLTNTDFSIYLVTTCTPEMTTCVAYADTYGAGMAEYLCADLSGLTTYYIVIDALETGGQYMLYADETVRQTNDTCATATVIDPIPADYYTAVDGYLTCMTDDYQAPTCLTTTQLGPEVVYSYTPTTNQNLSLMADSYYADWDISVYITTDCSTWANCVGMDDGLIGEPEFLHCIPVVQDTTYYIIIDSPTQDQWGRYYLEIWPVEAAANELCTNAEVITGPLPVTFFSDTSCAANDYSPTMGTCFGAAAPSNDLVWSYTTGSLAETVTVVLDPSYFTGAVYVVTDCADVDTCVAGDYAYPPGAPVILPCLAFAASTTYYIIVDGALSATEAGFFSLHLDNTEVPVNDDCTTATTITTFPAVIEADTFCAVSDYVYESEYLLGNDVVYHLNVATTANYNFSLSPLDFNAGYLLIEGLCPDGTVLDGYLYVAAGTTASLPCVSLTSGTDYFVIIAGDYPYDAGNFVFEVSLSGAADGETCTTGQVITVASFPFNHSGDTSCNLSDYDPGDGGCASQWAQPGPDKAFLLTPTSDVTIDVTLDSVHDASLYVLSPDCSNATTNCVIGVDDYYGGTAETFSVELFTGYAYYLIVDSPDTYESGMFTLLIEQPCIHNGDVNQDGSYSAGDAQMAFYIALGLYTPTFIEQCAADCNNDNDVTAGDAQIIFGAALGLDSCAEPLK